VKTAAKWVKRYREQGPGGLADRSSRPHRLYRSTSSGRIERVEALRRQRWTGYRIAQHTGLSRATVSRILRSLKLNRILVPTTAPNSATKNSSHGCTPTTGTGTHAGLNHQTPISRSGLDRNNLLSHHS
jgi:transposase